MKLLVVVVAALAFAGVASAYSPDEPGKLMVAGQRAKILGQYGRLWNLIDPRQRAAMRRPAWERCMEKQHDDMAALGIQPEDIRVIDEYDDTVTLPVIGRQKVRAVTLQADVGKTKISTTGYLDRYHGRWYGVIPEADRMRAYRAGRCPA